MSDKTGKSKIKSRGRMPAEIKDRWQKSLADAKVERNAAQVQARAIFAAHEAARELVRRLRAAREARGLSLADILERTGMTREALSRLENNEAPNPTVRTLARYAAAVGLELHLAAEAPRR
ncbi:MAG TPA: helix-turn-helix transcriptional regulator [Lacipirellulaceae bacterium]|jgi:DNA-binding phage protein|nr:helix-turn-helix transcriptional regulator [Lacipirellulaceae bacterium]